MVVTGARHSVAEVLSGIGFQTYHSSGQVMQWLKLLDDGDYLVVQADGDAEIEPGAFAGIDGDPDEALWHVSRHSEDGGFISLSEAFPLQEAVSVSELLPTVRGGIREIFGSVDEVLSTRSEPSF